MESKRRKRDKDGTVVSNLERILHNDLRIAAAFSVATLVGNRLIAPQSIEAASEAVTTQVPSTESEDTLDGLADRPVSKERPTLRILPRTLLDRPNWRILYASRFSDFRHG